MSKVIAIMSMSLDGYVANSDDGVADRVSDDDHLHRMERRFG